MAALLGVKPWLDDDARESRLKRLSSPQILHIATHGFFHPKDARETPADMPGTGLGGFAQLLAATGIFDNPLLRSGLALAGANCRFNGAVPAQDAEDGLLTAFDVTGMDLNGTQLVVLSACVTGLGDIHPSEGAMGLRRSFTVAGAQALLVSLWNVPDRATKTLMLEFYRAIEEDDFAAEGAASRTSRHATLASQSVLLERLRLLWRRLSTDGAGRDPLHAASRSERKRFRRYAVRMHCGFNMLAHDLRRTDAHLGISRAGGIGPCSQAHLSCFGRSTMTVAGGGPVFLLRPASARMASHCLATERDASSSL